MSQKILLKRSSIPNSIPDTSELALGELAINTHEGKIYLKREINNVETIIDPAKNAINSSNLGELKDISVNNIIDGEFLTWDDQSQKWVNTPPATHALADLTDVNLTSLQSGQVLKWDGSAWVPQEDIVGDQNVQSDWNENDNTSDAYIKNKPLDLTDLSLHNIEELSNVTQTVLNPGYILTWNGSSWVGDKNLGEPNVQSDWNESNVNSDAYILNKPTDLTNLSLYRISDLSDVDGAVPQTGQVLKWDGSAWVPQEDIVGDQNVQSDWNVTDAASDAYILNKPSDLTDLNLHSIEELNDIDLTNIQTDQILKWDGSKFIPVDETGGGGATALNDLIDVTITTPAQDQLLQFNSTTNQWENTTARVDGGVF